MIISSYPSATGDTNDGNLSLTIPQGGGLVAGRHTVKVVTNNVSGATLDLYAANSTSLTHTDNQGSTIPPVTISDNYCVTAQLLQDDNWGVAMPDSNYANQMNRYDSAEVYERYVANPGPIVDNGDVSIVPKFAGVISADQAGQTDMAIEKLSQAGVSMQNIYYGVRVDHPEQLLAGNYQAEVVYTATTNEVEKPTITNIDPNQYELGSNTNIDSNNRLPVTITGDNLGSTYKVYLENNADSGKRYDITGENIASVTDTQLKLTLPTDIANSDLEPGEYTIHVVTQGGEDILESGFTYTKSSSQSVYDQQANIRVDFDKGMIPVKYNESTEKWEVVTDKELDSNLDNWFDYDTKKWANAVTVTKDSQDTYYKARAGSDTHYEVNDGDILGYWVYVPRYAYKVMRRESTDRYVDEQNFEIKFETTANPTKTPVESCNADARSAAAVWKDGNRDNAVESNIKVGYYQDCPGVDTNYYRDDANKADSTAWATHPAFTWQYTGAINGFDKTIELNGLWVGKFEMTGSLSEPTILPNQKHLNQNLATLWSAVKSMGLADEYDQANSGVPVAYGKHNLSSSVTHMIKNSEWGAVAYLSASEYGVGAGLINMNQQEQAGVDDMGASSTGVTGCGPLQEAGADDRGVSYSDGGRIGTSEACSAGNPERAYNGSLGVLASTTGNEYGVYDMSGGAWDYALGNVTSGLGNATTVSPYEFVVDIKPPYVDLYRTADGFDGERPAWWITGTNMSQEEWNTDVCTWDTCGGHALYETENFQINDSVFQRSWSSGKYGTDAFFPILDMSINPDGTISSSPQPWIARGSAAGWWSGGTTGDSIFAYNVMAGDPNAAARAILIPTPDF